MIKNSIENIRPQSEELNGIYRGVIEDNISDPQKAGRCKIRVFGVHTSNKFKSSVDGIPTDELPWAEPAFSLFEGSVSGFGSWTVPLQGSHVFVFFEAGNPLQPRYFASAPGIPTEAPNKNEGFNDPDEEYPVSEINSPHEPNALDEPDFHKLGRNEGISDTIVQSKTNNKASGISTASGSSWDEPDSYYSAQYPDNKVFSTHSGITVEIDDTNGEERIHIYHPSNSYIEINKEGNVIIRNAKNKFEVVDQDMMQYVTGNRDSTIDGTEGRKVGSTETVDIGSDRNKTVGSNETEDISGNKQTTVGGSRTADISSSDDETIGSTKTITASSINLVGSTSISITAPSVSVSS